MTKNNRTIFFLRARIPSFICTPGCHDCCGPVTTSSEEMARLPVKSEEEHAEHGKRATCLREAASAGMDRWLVSRSFSEGWRLFSTFPSMMYVRFDPKRGKIKWERPLRKPSRFWTKFP